jgi:hypothetical protein
VASSPTCKFLPRLGSSGPIITLIFSGCTGALGSGPQANPFAGIVIGRTEPISINLRSARRVVRVGVSAMMEGPVDHFVKLDRLPEGVEFPPQLRDRIHFDPVARKLSFHGYMSKTDFDRLCQLSNDWAFRRTLEELFRLSIPEEKTQPHGVRRLLTAVTRLLSLG